jgi:multiple sugar transport system ATP-binding protein
MATVQLDKATRIYSAGDQPAVDRLDLEIADGEFLVLVGPSGCGKSTTLRMLAGLEPVDAGTIHIGDRDVTTMPPKDRDIAMVFQNYALYPHMTVAENIGFHLKIKGMAKAERKQRIDEAAAILDLGDYLHRKPAKLSGGQRQRVAMGRAIVREPQVFLMDEPLSNLDAKLRVQTRTQIAALQRRLDVTTVYVTHDQVEAMTMADRVAVLSDGILQQCATPRELFFEPANLFVAGFIGSPAMNLVPAAVSEAGAAIGDFTVPLTPAQRSGAGAEGVVVGIRPEDLEMVSEGGLAVQVNVVEELGSESFLYCTGVEPSPAGTNYDVVARTEGLSGTPPESMIKLAPKGEPPHIFDAASGRRLQPAG